MGDPSCQNISIGEVVEMQLDSRVGADEGCCQFLSSCFWIEFDSVLQPLIIDSRWSFTGSLSSIFISPESERVNQRCVACGSFSKCIADIRDSCVWIEASALFVEKGHSKLLANHAQHVSNAPGSLYAHTAKASETFYAVLIDPGFLNFFPENSEGFKTLFRDFCSA